MPNTSEQINSTLSRRSLLRVAGALTGVTSLSGCAEFLNGTEKPGNSEATPEPTTTETPGEPNIVISDHSIPDQIHLKDDFLIEYELSNEGSSTGEAEINLLLEEFNTLDSGKTIFEDSTTEQVKPGETVNESFQIQDLREITAPYEHKYTLNGPNNEVSSDFNVAVSEDFNWNDIIYHEERSLLPWVKEDIGWFFSNLEGNDIIGQDLKFNSTDHGPISYSHGGDYFDVNHFQETSFENAIQDLTTLMACKRASQKGDFGISGDSGGIGDVAEKAFEQLRNETTYWIDTGNEGHGFWSVIASEDHGYYEADSNTDLQGRPWEEPLEPRSGTSPIHKYMNNQFEIGRDSIDNLTGTNRLQDILGDFSIIEGYPGMRSGNKGVNASLLRDAAEEFYSEGNENLWRIKPAMAIIEYQQLIEPNKHHVLRADSWSDLPNYHPESNQDFSQYREQVESNILTLENEDEFEQYYFGEKT